MEMMSMNVNVTHLYAEWLGHYSDWALWTLVIPSYIVALYTLVSLFYIVIDVCQPKCLVKYKVQEGVNQPLTTKQILSTLPRIIGNLALLYAVGYATFPIAVAVEIPFQAALPSPLEAALSLLIILLCEEFAFYYSHRLLHWGPLYRRIHKIHHEWKAPIAMTAIYAHPIEFLGGNVFAIILGVFVAQAHPIVIFVWYTIAITGTLNVHSGYHFPFALSPEAHDFHHLKFDTMYGTLGLLDWFHGTDALFHSSGQSERHRVLFSLAPAEKKLKDKKKM